MEEGRRLCRDEATQGRIYVATNSCQPWSVADLKIHAFCYVDHTGQFKNSVGEVTGFITEGFIMNLLSVGGFFGAATAVSLRTAAAELLDTCAEIWML